MLQLAQPVSNNVIETLKPHSGTKFHSAWFIVIVIIGADAEAPPRIISYEEYVLFGAEGNVDGLKSTLDENMNYLDVRGQVKNLSYYVFTPRMSSRVILYLNVILS